MNLSYVIVGPVVTEKSLKIVNDTGYHTLWIHSDASKNDVKSAIEKYYDVAVDEVKVLNSPSKMRMRGRQGPQIKRKAKKKAMVKIAKGNFDLLNVKGGTKKAADKKDSKAKSSSDK